MDVQQTTSDPVSRQEDTAILSDGRQVEPGYCPECDYCLAGLTGLRCPECGHALDPAELTASAIPWVHRRRIGRFRAYWRTVWLVMSRGERFHREFQRPVSYRHAQRFRWVTVLLAYPYLLISVPALLPAVLRVLVLEPGGRFLWAWGVRITVGAVVCLASLLSLMTITALPSLFFHPRQPPLALHNRAVALGCYTCALLACTLLSPVLFGVATLFLAAEEVSSPIGLAGFLLPAALVSTWWFQIVRLTKLSHQRLSSRIVVGVTIPILWMGVGALGLIGLPLAAIVLLVPVVY